MLNLLCKETTSKMFQEEFEKQSLLSSSFLKNKNKNKKFGQLCQSKGTRAVR